MIASGELQGLAGGQPSAVALRKSAAMQGQPIAEGLGLGHAVLHQPRIVVSKIVADDVNAELARLETAIEAMRASVDDLIDRSDDGGRGRASRRARGLPHDRARSRLAAPPARGRHQRPDGRGGGRARAERRARQIATPDRPLSARPAARPHRHRQPAVASARRPEPRAAAGGTARQRHSRRALDEPGGAARLRPFAAARHRARGGGRGEPYRHRRARARRRRRQRHPQHFRDRRARRCADRRRPDRRSARAAAARGRGGLCREGAAARPPAGPVSRAARHAGADARRRRRSACT